MTFWTLGDCCHERRLPLSQSRCTLAMVSCKTSMHLARILFLILPVRLSDPSCKEDHPQYNAVDSSACCPTNIILHVCWVFIFRHPLHVIWDTWSRLLCVFYSELLASGGGQTSCRFSDLYRKHLKSSCNKCWILGHIPDQLNIYSDILLSLADSKKSPGHSITWVFLLITSQTFINGFRNSTSMQFPVIMAAIVLLCSVNCGSFIYTGVCLSKLWLISLPVYRRWTPAELKDS